MSVMSSLEDTGELRMLAEELRRIEQDPRRPGAVDKMLLSVAIGSAVVVGLCLTVLTAASDRFPVESGRIVLTMAAAATCVSPVMLGLWGVTRTHRRRHEQLMERFGLITGIVKDFAQARQAAAIGYMSNLQTIEVNLGILAAQVEEIHLLLKSPEPGGDDPNVHQIREAYRLGRRQRDEN